MTDLPQLPPDDRPPAYLPSQSQRPSPFGAGGALLPFSKKAIASLVLSLVGFFAFGFLGLIAVLLAQRALRDIRNGVVRGRGVAIAGMVIGIVGALFYILTLVLRSFS